MLKVAVERKHKHVTRFVPAVSKVPAVRPISQLKIVVHAAGRRSNWCTSVLTDLLDMLVLSVLGLAPVQWSSVLCG